MFFHLPSTLAACVLASSAVRASFVSSGQDGSQVVLDSAPNLALPTYERPVDALGRETYDGYSVVRFDAETVEKREELVRIGQLLNLDIWAHHASSVDILLPPSLPSFTADLQQASSQLLAFSAQPFIPSLQPLIDQTYPGPVESSLWGGRHRKHRPSPSPIPVPPPTNDSRIPLESTFHDSYHRLEEIYTFMDDLKEGWPSLVTIVNVGNSSEGREIRGIHIGVAPANATESVAHKGGDDDEDDDDDDEGKGRKKEFIVLGGQHAREWISTSTTLYFVHWLLVNVQDKDTVKHLLEEIDFTIIPVVNPDGYEYSFESSRLWRKTRYDSGSILGCKGIDPNRGWGYEWSELDHFSEDSVAGMCSDNYPGKYAFEAPEVRAVADYLQSQKVVAYLDIHSYGQLLMFPFSYSCERFPPDAEDLYEALLGATKSLRNVRGTEYMTGQACELVYRAPGDSIDFAYGSQDIKWSFSMELPDEGTYAFLLPPREIRPVGEETTEALFYLAKFVEKKENGGKFL